MVLQTSRLPEPVITMGTRVRALIVVDPQMLPEIVGSEEVLVAYMARVRTPFLLSVEGLFRVVRG